VLINGEVYLGKDGMAGEVGRRFSRAQYPASMEEHFADVVDMVKSLIGHFNPHRIFFYDEELTAEIFN